MRSADHPLFCLNRIENGPYRGWQFRTRRNGKAISRFFGEAAYGEQGALVKAQEYRDRILTQIRPAPSPTQETLRRDDQSPGSRAGVYLVRRPPRSKTSKRKRLFWVACWWEDGKSRTRSFSVKKHGHDQAKQLAIDAREAGTSKRQPAP